MTHRIAVGVLVGPRGVLMCRRVQSAKWYPGMWDFPGGHIEDGESAGEALARELLEEVAVTIVPPSNAPSFTVQANEGSPNGLALSGWVMDAWSGEPANVATDEHSEIRWLSPDDALGLDLAHTSYIGVLRNLRPSRSDGAPSR
ncbi:NUDIX domain-containing protein [Arthrobacter sp. NPDC056886]|uniref:NUDIX domain-containing protein n=1 Tax=Arthrobacter sp. NPDC056886 TaxID=3345960 RepID=UPI00366FDB0A